jgi:hypothetical protein
MMANEKPAGTASARSRSGCSTWRSGTRSRRSKEAALPLLAERYNARQGRRPVFVYAAGGYYYPGKDHAGAAGRDEALLELGYAVVKMKIGGESLADDIRRIEAVIKVVGSGRNVAVDANGRFDLRDALEYAKALAPYSSSGTRKRGSARFRAQASWRSTTSAHGDGENLFSMQDARNLIRYGGMRRTATGCNSTARSRTGWSSTCARWRC